MKIPKDILDTYTTFDPESHLFFNFFDEKEGSKILEVGAHDSPISSMLAKTGFSVHGVDLRECDQETHPNYTHHIFDFSNPNTEFLQNHAGTFDCVVSISALEHFGLGTYNKLPYNPYADVYAAAYISALLRKEGAFYCVVPYGGRYREIIPHWKVYDMGEIIYRFGHGMRIDFIHLQCSEKMHVGGVTYKPFDNFDFGHAALNTEGFPGISILVKFSKV